ncbi:hypothetical protein, partial [Bacillus sp. AFS076308]|uniref:hypothetical protein n=1 Tax=Bacillus sp. AFS076308 TaxID=2033512 RepID=UPI001C3F4425
MNKKNPSVRVRQRDFSYLKVGINFDFENCPAPGAIGSRSQAYPVAAPLGRKYKPSPEEGKKRLLTVYV